MHKLIDPHSHLLFGIDDGVDNLEEAVKVAQMYVREGFDGVFCTPHYLSGVFDHAAVDNAALLQTLKDELKKRQIPLQLYLGNEFYLYARILDHLKQQRGASLNETKYVLIEFPMSDYQADTEFILNRLMREGYVPIIAHPERYVYFREDPDALIRMIRKGAYVQVNSASFLGSFGKEAKDFAFDLLNSGMVHLIGTDTHRPTDRSLAVHSKMLDAIGMYTDELEEILYVNPQRILKGQPLDNDRNPVFSPIPQKTWRSVLGNLLSFSH